MRNRTQRVRPLLWLVGGTAGYLVMAYLAARSAHRDTGLKLASITGAIALLWAAAGVFGLSFSRVRDQEWLWGGLARAVAGGIALAVVLLQVPAGGYQGLPFFWADTVGLAGMLLVLYGLAMVIYGWRLRPSAMARREADSERNKASEHRLAVGSLMNTQSNDRGSSRLAGGL